MGERHSMFPFGGVRTSSVTGDAVEAEVNDGSRSKSVVLFPLPRLWRMGY